MDEGRRLDPGALGLLAAAMVLGVGVGALSTAFQLAVDFVSTGMHALAAAAGTGPGRWLVASVAGAALAASALALVRFVAPEAGGSGVQEVEGALEGRFSLRWRRVIPVKLVGSTLALGSGLALGREGPTVQMGASLGEGLAEWLRRSAWAHALIAAGGAAGLAAAFNAPLSGAIFVIEEMRLKFRFGFVSFQAVLVAAVASDVVTRAALGQGPQLWLAAYEAPALTHLPLFLLFGALLGALGVFFSRCILGGVARLAALPTPAHFGVVGLIGALVGALGQWDAGLVGGGYETIREAMTMRAEVAALLGLAALRFLLTVMSFGTGVPGGIFAPMLALGSLIGLAFGVSCRELGLEGAPLPGVFAVAGMAAFFASVVRAPITGIMLTLELTGDFGLVLAILVTCLAATSTAERLGGQPIYELLLERSVARRARDGPSARPAADETGD